MDLQDAIQGFVLLREAIVSPRTLDSDRLFLSQFADWFGPDRDPNEVTSQDVRGYIQYATDRGLAPSSVVRQLTSLSALYTWLTSADIGLADHHPVRGTPRPRVPNGKTKMFAAVEALLPTDFRTI